MVEAAPSPEPLNRRIRSFVRREGRLTPGQQRALETLWPRYGLSVADALQPVEVFRRSAPITLEIGFGNGASLAEMAANEPESDFIGIEDAEIKNETFGLLRNYPNPFNPETTISFSVPESGHVTLTIFNLMGQQVRVLIDEMVDRGEINIKWNSVDEAGNNVSSGIYLYRFDFDGFAYSFSSRNKMLLLQ